MISYHDIVFLKRPAELPLPPIPANTQLVERGIDFAPWLAALEYEQQRMRTLEMIRARFERGLRLFIAEQKGAAVGWSWLAIGSWRYIDELRWHIPLQEYQAWGRDAYIRPEARGQRLSRVLMGGVAEVVGHPVEYFSDVDARNRISLRAHAAAGFERVGRVRALELGTRTTWRGAAPAAIPKPLGLRTEAHWLRLSDDEWMRHREMLA